MCINIYFICLLDLAHVLIRAKHNRYWTNTNRAVNIKRKKGFIKVPDVFAFLCANITIFAYMTLQCKQNIRTLSGYLISPLLFGVKS